MSRPLRLRKLSASMEMKDLSLRDVVERANNNHGRKIPYTTASEILNGRRVCPKTLDRLAAAINSAPMPMEVAQ